MKGPEGVNECIMEQTDNVQFPEITDETEVPIVQKVPMMRGTPQLQCIEEVVRVTVAAQRKVNMTNVVMDDHKRIWVREQGKVHKTTVKEMKEMITAGEAYFVYDGRALKIGEVSERKHNVIVQAVRKMCG